MTSRLATDQEIAEINDAIRRQLKPMTAVETSQGPRYLIRIELSDKVAKLAEKSPEEYQGILEGIKLCSLPEESRRDFGHLGVNDGEGEFQTYYWWFKYWDSTHHFQMPNGHRELVIAHESEIDE